MMANFEYRLFLYPPSNEIGGVEGIQELSENKWVVYNIQYHSFLYPIGQLKKCGDGVVGVYRSHQTVGQVVGLFLKVCVSKFSHSFQVIFMKLANYCVRPDQGDPELCPFFKILIYPYRKCMWLKLPPQFLGHQNFLLWFALIFTTQWG